MNENKINYLASTALTTKRGQCSQVFIPLAWHFFTPARIHHHVLTHESIPLSSVTLLSFFHPAADRARHDSRRVRDALRPFGYCLEARAGRDADQRLGVGSDGRFLRNHVQWSRPHVR